MDSSLLVELVKLGGGYALAVVVLIMYRIEVNGKRRTLSELVTKNTKALENNAVSNQHLSDTIELLCNVITKK